MYILIIYVIKKMANCCGKGKKMAKRKTGGGVGTIKTPSIVKKKRGNAGALANWKLALNKFGYPGKIKDSATGNLKYRFSPPKGTPEYEEVLKYYQKTYKTNKSLGADLPISLNQTEAASADLNPEEDATTKIDKEGIADVQKSEKLKKQEKM